MKYRNFLIPALVAAAVGGAATSHAVAQQGQGQGRGEMMQGQGHGPGTMTQGEGALDSRHERRMQRWVERRMRLLDTDGDGKVSKAEIEGEQKRLFTAADVDGDGKLSADEFRRRGRWFFQLRTLSFFDLLDANGDGQITVEEINSPSGRWFKRYDTDQSGALEAEELAKTSSRRGRRGGRH